VNKIVVTVCLTLAATLAQAQVPSGNVFFGYSYSGGEAVLHAPGFFFASHSTNLNGWEGSLEGKFLPWIGIVADLSGHYGSQNVLACAIDRCNSLTVNVKTYTFLFGPRVSLHVGKFTPFAHFLVGAGHANNNAAGYSDSDTSLATAVGGGLDYKLIPAVALRLQGDELHTRFFGRAQDHFRFSTGLVIRF
jgi:opacity protein-like surface antigen